MKPLHIFVSLSFVVCILHFGHCEYIPLNSLTIKSLFNAENEALEPSDRNKKAQTMEKKTTNAPIVFRKSLLEDFLKKFFSKNQELVAKMKDQERKDAMIQILNDLILSGYKYETVKMFRKTKEAIMNPESEDQKQPLIPIQRRNLISGLLKEQLKIFFNKARPLPQLAAGSLSSVDNSKIFKRKPVTNPTTPAPPRTRPTTLKPVLS